MHPHWLLPAIFRRIDLARSEGLEPPTFFRRYTCWHPDPFRSVRDFGLGPADNIVVHFCQVDANGFQEHP